MISWGFCYGGSCGKAGYRPMGSVKSVKDAEDNIRSKLAGAEVTFVETQGKTRAYANGHRTGYIYFSVKTEIWVAVDQTSLGQPGEKSVIATGNLAEVKDKVLKYLKKEEEYGKTKVTGLGFDRTGDNVNVKIVYNDPDVGPYTSDAEVVLIRVPA